MSWHEPTGRSATTPQHLGAEEAAITQLRFDHDRNIARRGPYVDGAILIGTVDALRWAAGTLGNEHSALDAVHRIATASRLTRLAALADEHLRQIRYQIDRCLTALDTLGKKNEALRTPAPEPHEILAALRRSEREEVQQWLRDFRDMETKALNRLSRVARGLPAG